MSDEKENLSLIERSTGGLSRTANTFINKFSPAIKKLPPIAARLAKGEVAAMEIKAEGMVAVSEKLERAGYRIVWKEGNIESIARKAEEYMSPDRREEKAENLNQDWAATFADKCENTSDEEMQIRWAKILAGEADNPGTFSKKTLSVLSDMSKEDAKSFISLCQFVWLVGDTPVPLIYHPHKSETLIYKREKIDTPKLRHLQSMGLISIDPAVWDSIFVEYYETSQPTKWYYHNTTITLQPKKHGQDNRYYIPTGRAILTQSGKELFRICGTQKNDEFFEYMMEKWLKEGFEPTIKLYGTK